MEKYIQTDLINELVKSLQQDVDNNTALTREVKYYQKSILETFSKQLLKVPTLQLEVPDYSKYKKEKDVDDYSLADVAESINSSSSVYGFW